MKVVVERDLCIGSGYCVRLAPGAFELDADGLAVVIDAVSAGEDALRTAEASCPAGAIYLAPDERAGS